MAIRDEIWVGAGMLAAAWLAAAPLSAGEPAKGRPPAKNDPVEMAMDLEGGRPVLELRLEGRGPFRFLVDTGAQGSIISAPLASELGLKRGEPVRVFNPSTGKESEAARVTVASLTAGQLLVKDLTLLASDMPLPGSIKGVLSVRSFPPGLVTFDFPGKRIRLGPGGLSSADPGVMPCEYEPIVTLKGVVDGRPLSLHLDTGSPEGVMLPGALARELTFESEPVILREKGRLVVKTGRLKGTITIGPLVLSNPVVQIVDLFPDFGNIGSQFLADKVVTLDRDRGLIGFSTAK